MKDIKKVRDYLNSFTLENLKKTEYIKHLLIKGEEDILSLENNFENLDLDNKKMKKQSKKNKHNKNLLFIIKFIKLWFIIIKLLNANFKLNFFFCYFYSN